MTTSPAATATTDRRARGPVGRLLSGRLPSWRPAVVTMTATLGSWLTSWWIAAAAGLHADVIVLGTVLPVTLSRLVARRTPASLGERLLRLAAVPLVALAASEVGVLLAQHRWIGGGAFVAVLAAAVWVRRYGALAAAVGSLVSLPFVVLLVAPVAPAPGHEHTLWPALIGVVALLWVVATQEAGWRLGLIPRPPVGPEGPPARPARGLRASSKMAVQLGVGLAIAYALGTWWFPEHWPWMVLSCYVVCSGNRGRGDVVHKGVLRLGGALLGTAGATLLAGAFATGDRWALVILFAVMVAAVWLRPLSYAFWAGGVTAMLALLHGYYGEHGAGLLAERLAGVVVGAAIGVAVSWFVLPVRSRDAFRRRLADALAALAELLTAMRTHPGDVVAARHDLDYAVAQLELVEPAWRLHARVLGRHEGHPAELVRRVAAARDALRLLPPGTADRSDHAEWARTVGATRRRLRPSPAAEPALAATAGAQGSTDHPPGGPPQTSPRATLTGPEKARRKAPAEVERVTSALRSLQRELTRETWLRLGGS